MTRSLLLASITMISSLYAGTVEAVPPQGELGPAAEAAMERTPEERAAKLTARMKSLLSLTGPQVEKVALINLSAAREIDTAWKAAGDSRAAKRKAAEAIRAINEERDTKLAAVLTPEQAKSWEANKAERKAEARARAAEARKTP